MKRYLIVILLPLSVACKKDPIVIEPGPLPNPSDRYTVKLKEVNWRNLPSPHYKFIYDDSGYITNASYSSGLRMYDLDYTNGRIWRLRSNTAVNQDRLVYTYENQRVSMINYVDDQNTIYRRCYLSYNQHGQLTKMEWERRLGTVGFIQQRTVSFTYLRGNVYERHDYKPHIQGIQDELLIIDRFENYDSQLNADGFMLLQTEGEHMILLPGVKLQRNNPGRVVRSGTGINYTINYTYNYNQKRLPISKRGDTEITNGPDKGQFFQINVDFSYF